MLHGDDAAEVRIDGCKVNNVHITTVDGATAGIFAQTWANDGIVYMNDNEVEDLNIEYLKESPTKSSSSGGIMGANYGFGMVIDNNMVKHITIKNGPTNMGGLVGGSHYGGIRITNSKCIGKRDGEEVECSRLIPSASNQVIGGIVGSFTEFRDSSTSDFIIDNVECSDLEVLNEDGTGITNWGDRERSNYSFGGIIGFTYTNKNVTINNTVASNIIANLYSSENGNVGSYTLGGFAGGICNSSNDEYVNIYNVNTSNIHIKSNRGSVSGFITYIGANVNISNIEVDNCNLDVIDENYDKYGYSKRSGISGFIGVINYAKKPCKFNNININDVNIGISGDSTENASDKNEGYASGFIGCNVNANTNVDVSNVSIKNLSIKSKDSIRRTVSGAIGIALGTMNINNMVLDKATLIVDTDIDQVDMERKAHIGGIVAVNATKGLSIKDSKVSNVEMNNSCTNAIVGGIVAVSVANEETGTNENKEVFSGEVAISNSEANDITANGCYAVGGILGSGIAKINNVTVKNPKITAKTQLEGETPNGTAGGAAAIAVEGSELSNITVTSDKEDDEYGVFSDYLAGGICAINSGDSLVDSKVENLVVKTTQEIINDEFIDVSENEEEEKLIPNTDLSQSCADAVQARSWKQHINTIISKVKVIIGTEEKIVGE